jgi:tripartite-type tricarboxylate transporter receptor subunit TctC
MDVLKGFLAGDAPGGSAKAVGSTPDRLAAHVQAELAKWAPIVKESGAQIY